ncbi:MAG: NAD(P)/FAD-dependent oxidoreductase [Deltaproteobacteria bacterium]|nr:NAD(P)/FAD-dependent oxidoreductase [Deltaproteobacteria bacterium]
MPHSIYKPDRLHGPFDAIVIGSGIGGLSVAALLARAGKKVLVLERHYVAGGFTHTFSRKGYEWDVGLHYVGEVQRKNSLLRKVFDAITDSQLQWNPMPAVYDRVCIGEEVYEFEAPKARLIQRLEEYFPKERNAISEYFRLVEEIAGAAKSYYMAKAMPAALGATLGSLMSRRFHRLSDCTTYEVLSGLTSDARLIGVLTAQYGDYGLPPRESSFAIHALVARHYFDGGNYPVGGSGRIADTIIPMIEKAGGQVLVKAEVSEILLRDGKASGVRLADGSEVLAPIVISDAGAANTFLRLLPSRPPSLEKIRDSLADSNYWIYPDYDHDAAVARFTKDPSAPLPVTYLSFPSFKDPAWEGKFPGRSTVEAITFAPYEWFRRWESTEWRKRGTEYEALKEAFAQRLLAQLDHWVPALAGKIDYYEVSTPLSTRHFANYASGEIYGLDHTPSRFRQKWLKPATPIPHLYLTGQDVVSDGIAGALMGGVLAASAILKRNVLSELMRNS